MSRDRMMGIFANLLLECYDAKLITSEGNNKILRALLDNLKEGINPKIEE